MNILVSDKWLREYAKMKEKPEAFARAISKVGPSVERIYRQGADLEKIVVGQITELLPHPNADKLRLAKTSIGTEMLVIVCGGSNLAVGQLVAVALVGARVRWHGQGDLVTLEPATIRGVASEGMICGANEIGLADRFPASGEKEIVDLTAFGYKAGTPLAKALKLDDAVYDIEVTTNRPDALGIVGLAREAVAATGGEFLWTDPELPRFKIQDSAFKVAIQAKKLCPRYFGIRINGVRVGESDPVIKERLVSAGLRPINSVVDITNYVMLELGQPMHAFDADKLAGGRIVVREARDGEELVALDGTTCALKKGMLVIADAEKPVAVAGIMGGLHSGVTAETKNIVLEAASFDSTSVRRTGRALNLRTDAVMRFEKNLPQGLVGPSAARAAELVLKYCGGEIVASADVVAVKEKLPKLSVAPKMLSAKIGVELKAPEIKNYLSSLGFKVTGTTAKLSVGVPYWRAGDITIPEDLVEEVARLYGYHNLPSLLPPGTLAGEAPDKIFAVERSIRSALVSAGANDLVSTSLVGADLLKKSGEAEEPVARISNPLTTDLEFLRPSHRGRLLELVRNNEKAFASGSAFEIGNVFVPDVEADELPLEVLSLGIVAWGASDKGQIFFQLKGLVERAGASQNIELGWGKDFPKNSFWHPARSASVHLGAKVIGVCGELSPEALRNAGIESRAGLCLVDLRELSLAAKPNRDYKSLSDFPPVRRDLAFVLDRKAENESVITAIKAVDPLVAIVELFDHYEGKGIEAGQKSLAYHLTYQSYSRTLTAEEVDLLQEKISRMLEHKFKATIRA